MRNRLLNIFGKTALPTLIAGLALVFANPAAALAEGHGGGHGGGGGGGSHYSGGGRSFSDHGGGAYRGGGGYAYRGGDQVYRGGYYRGGGGYYRGGGLYLGFGAPYAYGYAPVLAPAPCGFYDRNGYWHADPACYNGVVGY
jgi:hypothetical protein